MYKSLLFMLLAALLLSGCDYLPWGKKNKEVLARVYNKYLYASEIQDLISPGMLPQDSMIIVSNYINNWVREQLLLQQAEKTLSQSQKDFSKQLENYRNSLIIYEYESNIIRQKLDTVVSRIEIQAYYDQNRANFELKENIVKVNYVQLENDPGQLPELMSLWQKADRVSLSAIERYCIQNGFNYSLFDNNWIFFSDLLRQVPITSYNQDNFLQFNRNIEVRDSLYVYLVEFVDYKIRESIAPLSMVENNIRKIIVNRRKLELMKNLQNEIFQNALKNNYFEIY